MDRLHALPLVFALMLPAAALGQSESFGVASQTHATEVAMLPAAPVPLTVQADSAHADSVQAKPGNPSAQQDSPQARGAKQLPVPLAGDLLYAPLSTGPETLADRFRLYAIQTYGPRAFFGRAVQSGIRMANPPSGYPDEWRQGMQAYGRNYGNAMASEVATNTARSAVAAVLHEDFRYRPATSTNFFLRTGHALAFTVVDRNDNGHWQPAIANFAGAAAGGYVGNAYLPDGYNDITHADQRMLRHMAGFAISNVLREFVPDIYHATQKLGIPFPRLPIPAWWTKWDASDGTPAGRHR